MLTLTDYLRKKRGHYSHINTLMEDIGELAEQTGNQGNYPVAAALLDKDGNILHIAVNTTVNGFVHRSANNQNILDESLGHTDGHAERNLMRWLEEENQRLLKAGKPPHDPQQLTLVCTLMPCPMCLDAMIKASGKGIGRIIAAAPDPDVARGSVVYAPGSESRRRADHALMIMPAVSEDGSLNDVAEHINHHPITLVQNRAFQEAAADTPPSPCAFDGQSLDSKHYKRCCDVIAARLEEVRVKRDAQSTLGGWNGEDVLGIIQGHVHIADEKSGDAAQLMRHFFAKTGINPITTSDEKFPSLDPAHPNDIPDDIVKLIAYEAARSYKSGNRFRATAVFDPKGHFMFVKGDMVGEKTPFHSSHERALKTLDRLHRDAPAQLSHYFAHPSQYILVGFEPGLGTAVRMAGVKAKDVRIISGTEKGAFTSHCDIPPFYTHANFENDRHESKKGRNLLGALHCVGNQRMWDIIKTVARDEQLNSALIQNALGLTFRNPDLGYLTGASPPASSMIKQ